MNTVTTLKKVAVLSIVMLLVSLVPHSQAQQGIDPASDSREAIKFEHMTMANGLSSNFTISILQDSQGFMWFGTRNGGLNKYDGAEFTIYTHDPDNPNSLGNNYVWYLFEDSNGTLWVCTWGGGLDKFDPPSETFTHYRHDENNPDSLSNNLVWSAYEDSKGRLWVGTDGGLNRFDPASESFIHYQHDPNDPQSLSSSALTHIDEDQAGNLWISTYGGGLNKFDPDSETAVRYQHDPNNPDSLSNDYVWSVFVDDSGTVWLGTEGGVDRFDPARETFTHYQYDETDPNSLSDDTVTYVYQDRSGMLWIGTFGGLNKFDPVNETFSRYLDDAKDPNSLSNDLVWYIFEDDTGMLWVTTDNGVNKYDPDSERFVHYQHNPKNPNSLSDNLVSAIYGDDGGILWLGTKGGGLDKFDRANNAFVHYQHEENNPNSLNDNNVMAIHPDSSGMLWLGTEGGGLDKFDPVRETFVHYQYDPGNPNTLDNDSVVDIDIDSAGILWIGTYGGGLNRFDPQSEIFEHYTQDENDPNSLASLWVRTVHIDSTGAVWVGSEGGLSRFDPGGKIFTNYLPDANDPASLSNDTIGTIYEDSRGIIWIGTNDGLNKFDRSTETFTIYRNKQGLAGNGVNGILEDDQGILWVGTNNGLSRFDPQQETFRNYDAGDGLQSNLFLLHSAYKSDSGELFFGGVGGFNAFYPSQLNDNPNIPPVVLTDLQLFNQPVAIGGDSPLQQHINLADQITLSHDQSVFSFKFSALNYRSPEKNQYAYKMEGFDHDWTYVDSQRRFATYTNLDPGSYTFRVKASNNDGLWNEQGVSIKIVITPPWWKTWWFRTLAGVLVVGLVFGAYRWRVRAMENRNRWLESEVADRTRRLREQTIELAQAKDRAEAANRAKSVFLANMSHELRTPLNTILGFTQLMRRDPTFSLSQQKNLRAIHQSGEYLLELINDVLEISKIEAGRATFTESDFDLHQLLAVLESMFGVHAQNKGLRLHFERAPDVPRHICTDERKLRQVLINLLSNAIKFTEMGSVALRVKQVGKCQPLVGASERVSSDELADLPTCKLVFEVEDTGVGIAPREINQLFEAFTQTASGRKALEGTGLGLLLSQRFVQLLGGEISVNSTVGKGSLFRFEVQVTLPADVSEIEGQESRIQESVVGITPGQRPANGKIADDSPYRILVVEDSEVNRIVLVQLLTQVGFEVREAVHGEDAIEVWQAWKPHLIWMDMRMPVMDGYEATKRIKSLAGAFAPAIIALTAHAFEEERAVILAAGCDGFVRKPFREAEIFDTMAQHLDLHYVYQDLIPTESDGDAWTQIDLTPSDLADLPAAWVAELRHAAARGRDKYILDLIEQIRPTHARVSEGLELLVHEFRFDKIMVLTE